MRDQLIAEYGAGTVRSGGLKVYTTIDPRFQRAAQKAIKETLYEPDDPAAGVISINPKNGAIRAMTAVIPGNKKNQFNLLSQARRQSGSTFKTFVLAAAVEQGINPETTTYLSAPFFYRPDPNGNCEDGTWWCPETYDHSYTGWTTIERATLRSDNTVFAQLTLDVTPEAVAEMATKLGVRSPLAVDGAFVPSIGLGAMDVSPLDMASVRDARRRRDLSEPMAIRKVILPTGEDKSAGWGKPKRKRVISDGVADAVTQILEQNVDYGTGTGADYGIPPPARPGRRRSIPTPGSAATRRGSAPPSGSGTRAARSRWRACTGSRSRRLVPGADLAALHELGDRPARAGGVPGAEGLPRVGGVRARPVRPVVRLLRRRQLHAARNHRFGRDDRAAARRVRPDAPPASRPAPKPKPAPKPTPAPPTTLPPPPETSHRRFRPSPYCPEPGHADRGGSGRRVRLGVRRLRVGRRRAARARRRRTGGRRLARRDLPRAARPRIRRVSGGARARSARRAGAPSV